MTRLGRSVDQQLWLDLLDQVSNATTVSDIEFAMREVVAGTFQPLLIPAGIAGGAEEFGAHIVVNSNDTPASGIEVRHDLGTNESIRPGDQNGAHTLTCESDFLGMRILLYLASFNPYPFPCPDRSLGNAYGDGLGHGHGRGHGI